MCVYARRPFPGGLFPFGVLVRAMLGGGAVAATSPHPPAGIDQIFVFAPKRGFLAFFGISLYHSFLSPRWAAITCRLISSDYLPCKSSIPHGLPSLASFFP